MDIKDVLEFIEEEDVKFVRLGFCDPQGVQKNISIMSTELESAFYNGITFDASAIKGFLGVENSELLLFPDPKTLTILPWRHGPGSVLRFFCDIKNPDKTPFYSDSRFVLTNSIKRLENLGFNCKIGSECEFYLFKTDEDGNPTYETLDKGGYLDISPLDKGENIRRDICLCLEEMGIKPETSHHEQGPGQNEIDFKFSDVLSASDNIMTFKSVVKSIATSNGLFASFMPKPIPDKSGSGMHVNISLYKDGENLLSDHNGENFKYAKMFLAGILAKIREITLFLNSSNNSYERLGSHEAPKFVSWSHGNRSQLIRIPVATTKSRARFELRSPDSATNPYIAFALILEAGIYGIKNKLELQDAFNVDLYKDTNHSLDALPKDLGEAISLTKNSEFIREVLDERFIEKYLEIKTEELLEFEKLGDKQRYYKENYFEIM